MSEPSTATIKKLFGLSENQCAFPTCSERIIDKSGTLIGEVCHICGNKPDAKRYDQNQTEAERQDFDNLILLCRNHHKKIDDDAVTYSVTVLRQMKRLHEQSATEKFVISDKTAERILLIMAGGGASLGIYEIFKEIGNFIGALKGAFGKDDEEPKEEREGLLPDEIRFRRMLDEMFEVLRYAPKGVVAYAAHGEEHRALGDFFGELFRNAGWRNMGSDSMKFGNQDEARKSPLKYLAMAFLLPDPNQVDNARQAVDEVFAKFGFKMVSRREEEDYLSTLHDELKAVLIFGERRALWSILR